MVQKLRELNQFMLANSIFLLVGTVCALIWANLDNESYKHMLHLPILNNHLVGEIHGDHRVITSHYFLNDILMALFFAIAAKEIREAFLKGGALEDIRKAGTLLFATVGGTVGPALIYVGGAILIAQWKMISDGWAVPCATDIAFSLMVARIIFGPKHPAIPVVLFIGVVDDGLIMAILAICFPAEEIQPLWMLLPVIAVGLSLTFWKVFRLHSFWWYILIPGTISWFGFALTGVHPSLGLLPVIFAMPHAQSDLGMFAEEEMNRHDTLNEFEHWWKNPVELILGLFGLMNAGVVLNAIGDTSYLVMTSLLVGKPLFIFGFGMFAAVVLKLGLPDGVTKKEMIVVGCAAAIGFTVALFMATVAFPAGNIQDAAKMGALLSFLAAPMTFIAAKLLKVGRFSDSPPEVHAS